MIAWSSIAPSGSSSSRAAAEELVEVLPAHRLDHLDRDELVVAAPQVAVVVAGAPRRGRPARPRAPAAVASSCCSARDRGGGDPAAVGDAACRAIEPQPVPISSRWSSSFSSSLRQTRSSFSPWASPGRCAGRVEHRRTSRSWSRRGTARTGRCRGRSGRRCAAGCPRGCCAAPASVARTSGAISARRRSSRGISRRDDPHQRDQVVAVPVPVGVALGEPELAAQERAPEAPGELTSPWRAAPRPAARTRRGGGPADELDRGRSSGGMRVVGGALQLQAQGVQVDAAPPPAGHQRVAEQRAAQAARVSARAARATAWPRSAGRALDVHLERSPGSLTRHS